MELIKQPLNILLNDYIYSNLESKEPDIKETLLYCMGTIAIQWEEEEVKEKLLNFSIELLNINRKVNFFLRSTTQTTQDEKDEATTQGAKELNTLIETTAQELIKKLTTTSNR
jgi:hypothetical protein